MSLILNISCSATSVRKLSDDDVEQLCAALASNHVLVELLASGHSLSPRMLAAYARMLRVNTGLQTLALGCAGLGCDGLQVLIEEGLQHNTTLKQLDLSFKGLDGACGPHLAKLIRVHPNLQELKLARNAIGHSGLATLLETLPVKLTRLNLEQCELDAAAVSVISDALSHPDTALTHLTLAGNNLHGLPGLGLALGQNRALQELVLDRCQLQDSDVCGLGAGLNANTTLERLSLHSNADVTDAATGALAEWLRQPHGAGSDMDLGQTGISPQALLTLTTAARLQRLGLFGNNLGAKGLVEAVIAAPAPLRALTMLEHFDIGGNKLNDELVLLCT